MSIEETLQYVIKKGEGDEYVLFSVVTKVSAFTKCVTDFENFCASGTLDEVQYLKNMLEGAKK